MKNKTTIDIDLDIYKAIVQHSDYINEPANAVLRRLLNLNGEIVSPIHPNLNKSQSGGLMVKGVFLKSGLKLRKHFKGSLLEAEVHNGFIEFNKEKFKSPSGAAVRAADGSVNGWIFWDFFDETDGTWKQLETLRKKRKSAHNK